MSKFRLFCWTALLSLHAVSVQAASFSLTDQNSSLTVNDRNGVTVWLVDGRPDNVFISNYYYRVGPTGNENNFLDGLSVPTVGQPAANRLALTYRGTDLQAVVNYELTGGNTGSNRSKLVKSVILTNLSTGTLDLNLFDYSDLDIRFNQLAQRDRAIALTFDRIVLDSATFPLSVLTNVSPTATNYQISDFFTLYTKFFIDLDGPTTLDNTPPLGISFPQPPGDNAFAFQWTFRLNAGQSLTFESSFDYAPVPEPSSLLALLCLGLVGIVAKIGKSR